MIESKGEDVQGFVYVYRQDLLKWAILDPFCYFRLFKRQHKNVHYKVLLMTGFKLLTSGIEINCSAN